VSWLETNRDTLRELFHVLQADVHWSDDPETLVRWMEQNWLGAEHGRQAGKPVFDDDMQRDARPLLAELGFTGRVEPPGSTYDEVIVLGAAGAGLHRRLELVRTSGIHAAGLTVLAGLRPHERQRRDGGLAELLSPEGRFAAAPGWTTPPQLQHAQMLLHDAGVEDDYLAAAITFPAETDLAELLLIKQWPGAHVSTTVHGPPHPVTNELGQRPWALRTWTSEGPLPVLRVLSGAPVERAATSGEPRPPRPTTASTFDEWLVLIGENTSPQRVLAVVNQPHLQRVREQLTGILRRRDCPITLDVAGCETLSDVDIVLVLGEIPASIRTDGLVASTDDQSC